MKHVDGDAFCCVKFGLGTSVMQASVPIGARFRWVGGWLGDGGCMVVFGGGTYMVFGTTHHCVWDTLSWSLGAYVVMGTI